MKKTTGEILSDFHSHHEEEIGITWLSALEAMQAYADQETSELKEQVELSKATYSGAIEIISDLRGQIKSAQSEITQLRSRLDECRKKQMMG